MKNPSFSLIGHRGCSSLAPENTRASIIMAAEQGAHGVELDVVQTKDKQLIIFHDHMVDRCSNGQGPVESFTLNDIKKLDIGSWFSPTFHNEHIIPVNELFPLLHMLNLNVKLELKKHMKDKEQAVSNLKTIIHRIDDFDISKMCISSEDENILEIVHHALPNIHLGFVLEPPLQNNWYEIAQKIQVQEIHLRADLMTQEMMDNIHAKGLRSYVWTVNDKEHGERLIRMGIHGLMTDYPQIFEHHRVE